MKDKINNQTIRKAIALYKSSFTHNSKMAKEILEWFEQNAENTIFKLEIDDLLKLNNYQLNQLEQLPTTIKQTTPRYTREDLFLEDSVIQIIDKIQLEFRNRDKLRKYKTNHRSRVILHGPSGCGKTSIAHMLATELDLPLYMASHSMTVDSHLGETNKNIEKMLSFVEARECVFLFDEFDSVAKARGSGDLAEMSRVVNMLLTKLDDMNMKGIFIACTNRFDDIDDAIKRRFDVAIEIKKPAPATMFKMVQRLTDDIKLPPEIMGKLEAQTNDKSPAELTKMCQALKRDHIINNMV